MLAAHIPPPAPRCLRLEVRAQRRRRVSRGNRRRHPASSPSRSGAAAGWAAARKRAEACPSPGPRGPDGVAGHERADSLPAWRLDPGTVGSTEGGRERGQQPKQIDRSGECVRVCFSLPPSRLGCLIDRSYVSAGGNWSFLPALEKNRFRLVLIVFKMQTIRITALPPHR